MKRALIAIALTSFVALPAFAQDAGQIASVKQGADCEGCNLFQADFSMDDLSGRNLSGSRLRQANLEISTLDKANLTNANLSVANLFGVRMSGTNLTGANLKDATLVGGWFGGANFTDAQMEGAVLSGSYLVTAKGLTQAQLATTYCDTSTELPKGLNANMCRSN
ncbi:pentapeptide repeat-containing protein [Hirschia litorea]|uniref:Pentapeptide repeat-containing protein n=1 Tax=Hirschia litorea TaxID=1199156 RepID=A0ABW2II39_9PROT